MLKPVQKKKQLHPKPPVVALGVTGGVAAFKAIELCRILVKAGVHVVPVLTESAQAMVGAKTFDALASEASITSLWDADSVSPHTELAKRVDLVVVCPATARVLSDIVTGRSADVLTTTILACDAPLLICPAMHTEMWENPAVAANIAVLQDRGVAMVGPVEGQLAGSDSGMGRLADPADIAEKAFGLLGFDRSFVGKKVLVTAGASRQAIDPVRYITNRSSGKQGHALAESAARRGAEVTLVTSSSLPAEGVSRVVEVETAEDMLVAVLEAQEECDIILMCAAVADFTPKQVSQSKIRKSSESLLIELVPTKDILAELGTVKKDGQIVVGFSAQDSDDPEVAIEKLKRKNLDLIVMNNFSEPGAGFATSTNKVTVFDATGPVASIGLADKSVIAGEILNLLIERD